MRIILALTAAAACVILGLLAARRLRQREEAQMHKVNEYKKQYFRLQDYYRQAELAIHALSQNEQNVE